MAHSQEDFDPRQFLAELFNAPVTDPRASIGDEMPEHALDMKSPYTVFPPGHPLFHKSIGLRPGDAIGAPSPREYSLGYDPSDITQKAEDQQWSDNLLKMNLSGVPPQTQTPTQTRTQTRKEKRFSAPPFVGADDPRKDTGKTAVATQTAKKPAPSTPATVVDTAAREDANLRRRPVTAALSTINKQVASRRDVDQALRGLARKAGEYVARPVVNLARDVKDDPAAKPLMDIIRKWMKGSDRPPTSKVTPDISKRAPVKSPVKPRTQTRAEKAVSAAPPPPTPPIKMFTDEIDEIIERLGLQGMDDDQKLLAFEAEGISRSDASQILDRLLEIEQMANPDVGGDIN